MVTPTDILTLLELQDLDAHRLLLFLPAPTELRLLLSRRRRHPADLQLSPATLLRAPSIVASSLDPPSRPVSLPILA